MIEERAEDIPDTINKVAGEDAVRISKSGSGERESSGSPRMADKRLRIKVFNVGRSKEYINVEVDAFHKEVAPLVVQSCPRTSNMAEGSLIFSIYFGRDTCGMYPDRSVIRRAGRRRWDVEDGRANSAADVK